MAGARIVNALTQWMLEEGIPVVRHAAAMARLRHLLGAHDTPASTGRGSEARQQGLVRLAAPSHDTILWRNNVGALLDARGVPIRYGLANDTKEMNQHIKSADLIGERTITITPQHVGSVIGQFASYEVKHESWRWTGDAHEQAQLRWALIVQAGGGDARFITSPDQL